MSIHKTKDGQEFHSDFSEETVKKLILWARRNCDTVCGGYWQKCEDEEIYGIDGTFCRGQMRNVILCTINPQVI